jgi:hypothetical protein
VGGVLPTLDDEPEPGTGRVGPREPAAARDYDEAAGHLADGDVDLILVETRVGEGGSRIAVEAAAGTGIATWVATIGGRGVEEGEPVSEAALATWAEASIAAGAAGIIFPDGSGASGVRLAEAAGVATWGGLVSDLADGSIERLATEASAWLEAGAGLVGLLRRAGPERVAAVRATIDERIRAALEREAAATGRWDAAVRRGASMAPGGAALWLATDPPPATSLPAGFEWTIAPPGDLRRLPEARFRLVVAAARTDIEAGSLAAVLDVGAILVIAEPGSIDGPALRILDVDEQALPRLVILRREA